MNIFGSKDEMSGVQRLEAQLKQKAVQMDNLENALIKTRKELEESRRERETAKQDAFLHERRVDASEAELAKVLRDAKQKAETVDCLTSTLQARGVELAQKEKAMRDVNHELMLACRERDGSAQHNTALSADIQAARASARDLQERIAAERKAHTAEVAALSASLAAAADEVQVKADLVAQYEARLQSSGVESENCVASMKSIRSQMQAMDKERTSDSQSAASTVEGLEAALREARTSAARQAAQMANLESTLASERRDHDEVAQQLAATRADLQAAINQDSNQAGEWQAQYSSLEGARDRAVAKAHEATAALQRVTESHDKMQAKVLQLASERDHVRLQFEEHKDKLAGSETGKRKKPDHEQAADVVARDAQAAALQAALATAENRLEAKKAELDEATAALASAKHSVQDVRRDFFEQQREALQHAERAQKAEETVAVLRAHVEDLQARLEGAEADAASARAGRDRLQLENKDAQREMQRLRDQLDAAKDVGVRAAGASFENDARKSAEKRGGDALAEREVADLRGQLQQETDKRKQLQQQLLQEQRHFAGQLQTIQAMTRGAPTTSPGGAVFGHVQRLQRQLNAVQDGQDIAAVQNRSMLTPIPAVTSPGQDALAGASSVSVPTASTAQAPAGRLGTGSTARTPLSVKSNALDDENAAYWHKRYEAQALRIAALESEQRRLSVQVATPRSTRRLSIGAGDATPKQGADTGSLTARSPMLSSRAPERHLLELAPAGLLPGQENGTPTLGAGAQTAELGSH